MLSYCQETTNRATLKYRDRERKGSDTYTNCKLKMERQEEGKNTENKGGNSQDIKKVFGRKLSNSGSSATVTNT